MKGWSAERIARTAGASLVDPPSPEDTRLGPDRVVIDSRAAGPGSLFVGLRGGSVDGGEFAAEALAAGAWGAIVAPAHAVATIRAAFRSNAVVLVAADPLGALQRLATAWRLELGATVIAVTGSTGKTSTKDLLRAVLEPHRQTVASRANFNTEIGLPLEILGTPAGTQVLVLEMGMRGAGQIAQLAAIARPDVAVIVSVGPVHLEALGTIEAVAAAKAELIAALAPGASVIVPAGETLLTPHLRDDLEIVTFGEEGDVRLLGADGERLRIGLGPASRSGLRGRAGPPCSPGPAGPGDTILTLDVSFPQAHLRTNLLAAVAAARAVGVSAGGRIEHALSAGRGATVRLAGGVTVIDDCYNANPMSMRAALHELAAIAQREHHARRVAVLGDMLELGPGERAYHAELGEQATRAGVDLMVTVGPLAAAIAERFEGDTYAVADAGEAAGLLPELLAPGDAVLLKASRGVGLELVCRALSQEAER